MKIEIKEIGSDNYYDEYLYLINNYKKIHSNTNKKIKKLSSNAYLYLAISSILFIIYLVWYLISKEGWQIGIIIFSAFLILFSLYYLFLIKSNIKKISKEFSKNTFEITNKYIELKVDSIDYKLKFEEIKSVIFGRYTMTFIPNDFNKVFITVRIEYKDEVIKTLKKYKKDNLIKNNK